MRQREFFSRGRAVKLAKSTWTDRTRESPIVREVEYCLSHFGFFVIPRDTRASSEAHYSIWMQIDSERFIGVVWRNNTGSARMGGRFVRFGVPGRPDLEGWLFGKGRRFGIEVKTAGGKETTDQRACHDLSQRTGVLAGVVRSYLDTENLLKSWGLKRPARYRGMAA